MYNLTEYLQKAQDHFSALFEESAPKALRVWAKGASVWCNAPLQYMSYANVSMEQAKAFMAEHLPDGEAWQILANGMLETKFSKEAIVHTAKTVCGEKYLIRVNDSEEAFFFEKCTAIRGRHVLLCADLETIEEKDFDMICDALLVLQREVRIADIKKLAAALDARLDEGIKRHERRDAAASILLCVLEQCLKSFDKE